MTKLTEIIVELVDDKDKKIASYKVKRLNVRTAIRRENMFMNIHETEMSIRGQMFACASLACVLHDEDGKPVFPEKDYPENTAIDELFDYDYEVYLALSKAYLEVNPVAPTLSAKKKKS
jgi:hypothetical protein